MFGRWGPNGGCHAHPLHWTRYTVQKLRRQQIIVMITIVQWQLNKIYWCFNVSVNWDDIKNAISYSNVIQRDNLLFAKKLNKNLVSIAKEGDEKVSL